MIGLAVLSNSPEDPDGYDTYKYILLHFDGYGLNLVETVSIGKLGDIVCKNLGSFRAVLIDDYLYVLGTILTQAQNPGDWENTTFFAVEKIW